MPKFSKRHYTAVANILREAQTDSDRTLFTPIEVVRIADLMSRAFAKDNGRFDRDKFLIASGVVRPSIMPALRASFDYRTMRATIVNSERER